MWLRSNDERRTFHRTVVEKDVKGVETKITYSVGPTPVEVPDKHVDLVMGQWPQFIEAVPGLAKPRAVAPESGPPPGKPKESVNTPDGQYFCTKCGRTHMLEGSVIGTKHLEFKR